MRGYATFQKALRANNLLRQEGWANQGRNGLKRGRVGFPDTLEYLRIAFFDGRSSQMQIHPRREGCGAAIPFGSGRSGATTEHVEVIFEVATAWASG